MIEGYDTGILLTSGNSLVLLCVSMIVYGIWKILRISSRSRRSETGSVELNRIMAEAAVLNIKKREDAKKALLRFENSVDAQSNEAQIN